MGDEFRFAEAAFSASGPTFPFGNFLGNQLLSLAEQSSMDWYPAIKLINGLVWAFLSVPVFIFFRKSNSTLSSGAVAVGVTLLPLSIFAGTALPEIPYYVASIFGMTLLGINSTRLASLIVGGALIGVAMLAKPHAFVLLVALSAALVLVNRLATRKFNARDIGKVGIFASSALLVRFAAGFAIAGIDGFSLSGNYFRAAQSLNTYPIATLASGIDNTFGWAATETPDFSPMTTVLNYLLAFIFIFGVPVILISLRVFAISSAESKSELNHHDRLGVLSVASSLALLVMAVIFAMYVTSLGDDHSNRVLFRYVDFAYIPISIAALSFVKERPSRRGYSRIALLVFSTSAAAGLFLAFASDVKFNVADSTLLTFFIEHPEAWFVGNLALVIPWGRAALKKWIFVPITSVIVVFLVNFIASVGNHFNADQGYLEQAKLLDLSTQELSHTVFIGTDQFTISSTMMELGAYDSRQVLVAPFSEIDPEAFGNNAKYLVLVGSTDVVFMDAKPIMSSPELSLFHAVSRERVFSPDGVANISGIGVLTDWGYWVDGASTRIEFSEGLSPGDNIALSIRFHPYYANRDITISTSDGSQTLTLGDTLDPQPLSLTIENPVEGWFEISAQPGIQIIDKNFLGNFNEFSFGVSEISLTRIADPSALRNN